MNTEDLIYFLKNNTNRVKVDLHIHTNYSDGEKSPEYMLNKITENKLEVFSITDHNTVNAYNSISMAEYPNLITGVEFDCWHNGVFMHLLGYGFDLENKEMKKFFVKNKRDTENVFCRLALLYSAKDLIKAIHDAGGIAVLAHPACCLTFFSLDNFVKSLVNAGLDGIEVIYPYKNLRGIVKFHNPDCVEKIANKYNLLQTKGSDSHKDYIIF